MQEYLKTVLLLGVLSVLLIFIGGFIAGKSGLYFAFLISMVMNGVAYFYSDKIALAASNAKPLAKNQYPEVYDSVKEIAKDMKIPMPELFITPDTQANAFATGRSPDHASVAVTSGIVNLLSKNELKGVIAHELSHVKNRDILIASVAAVLASTITFLSRFAMFGGFGEDRQDNKNAGILGILVIILAPLAAMLIQLAVSRQREFGADESGAKILKNGEPLADALLKINHSTQIAPARDLNPAFSSLYIANPFGQSIGGIAKLFSTHPPVEERVKRLREMKFK